jgi:drug/metabolite transporter (DMT)-like permease
MDWLLVAIIAYFLIALESILDKFLLSSQRVGHPATYAFYSGLLSLAAFLLFPLGFHLVSLQMAWQEILAGAIFTFGILFIFFAIKNSEASQVIPVVGATTTIITYVLSFIFLGEHLSVFKFWGIVALIVGGLLISLDFSTQRLKHFFDGFLFSILAGFFMAVAFTWFKRFYEVDNFLNVYIWTRIGLMLGACSFFLYAPWRKVIWSSLTKFKKPQNQDRRSGILFVGTKALGGIGSFLINYAISLGSVTIVNALVSVEYVFIFGLAYLFFKRVGKIFAEKRDRATLIRKFIAVGIIAVGMFWISL